jgi:hypothetical protein
VMWGKRERGAWVSIGAPLFLFPPAPAPATAPILWPSSARPVLVVGVADLMGAPSKRSRNALTQETAPFPPPTPTLSLSTTTSHPLTPTSTHNLQSHAHTQRGRRRRRRPGLDQRLVSFVRAIA